MTKLTNQLFAQFAAFYGHIWRSQFKDEKFLTFTKVTWQEGLAHFSETIVQKAILHCRSHCELPPTLPQLVQICRQLQRPATLSVIDFSDWQPVKPETVTNHLQQCLTLLKS